MRTAGHQPPWMPTCNRTAAAGMGSVPRARLSRSPTKESGGAGGGGRMRLRSTQPCGRRGGRWRWRRGWRGPR
eukprot:6540209-Prymnesium_polylepis.1